jgi:hypothetical protein
MCSTQIAHNLDWNILSDLYGSDHFPIIISCKYTRNLTSFPAESKWLFEKADWSTYQENIIEKINVLKMHDDNDGNITINRKVEGFTKIIMDAANSSIPKTQIHGRRKTVPWWNNDCFQAMRASKRAFNKYKRHRTEEMFIEYKKCRSFARITYKKSKQQSWKNYVSSLNGNVSMTDAWHKINRIRGNNLKPYVNNLISDDDQVITDSYHISNILAEVFSKNSSDSNYDPQFLSIKNTPEYNMDLILSEHCNGNRIINCNFSIKELQEVIKSLKNSSPGPDGVFNVFIIKLPIVALEYLLELYNQILHRKEFPEKWREAKIVPVLKPNRDGTKAQNYRPIALHIV